jgi:hypothetical protein
MSVASTRPQNHRLSRRATPSVDGMTQLKQRFGWEIRDRAHAEQGVWYTETVENIHYPELSRRPVPSRR